MITIAFTDETIAEIVAEQKKAGFILIEEQRNRDPARADYGNWLLFDKTRPVEPLSEVEILKQKVAELETKVTALSAKV